MAQPAPTHVAGKVAEVRTPEVPSGDLFGSPGPDQGYALLLAHRLTSRIHLLDGEDVHDIEVGAALIGSRRASLFGRAPSVYDLEVALGLFGFFDSDPSAELIELRRSFRSIGHSYVAQRELVDLISDTSLRMTPAQAAARPLR